MYQQLLRLMIVSCFFLITNSFVFAADHLDPPNRATDPEDAKDIADFYAWTRGSGSDQTLVMVLTFAGLAPAGQEATYNRDVLYTINIDNTADNQPNTSIIIRFGQKKSLTVIWRE